jgi:hypothetical protein
MLVLPRLVFVHIPRTAGSFIRQVFGEHFGADPAAPRFSTHASYDELPSEFRDRPAFCLVRNPWDWYVSWYHHTLAQGERLAGRSDTSLKRANWQKLFRSGRAAFGEVIADMCEGRLEHAFAESARRRDVDLYSEYVRVLAGRAIKHGRLEAGRFEELVSFLLRFLARHELLTDSLRAALEQSPRVNASEHGPYRQYYDDELRDLVAHKARWLTARFGYSF